LKICVDRAIVGHTPQTKAFLFVNGIPAPFSEIRYTSDLRQYDNKIIECSYRADGWHFHRQRTDKSFPNFKGMLI
jgi:mRNA-capping enzyme